MIRRRGICTTVGHGHTLEHAWFSNTIRVRQDKTQDLQELQHVVSTMSARLQQVEDELESAKAHMHEQEVAYLLRNYWNSGCIDDGMTRQSVAEVLCPPVLLALNLHIFLFHPILCGVHIRTQTLTERCER